jgi:putative MATE family efflux protein
MMTFFIGLIMAVTGFILAGPMVRFMGANEETFADAQIYMKIQMIGFLPLALTFVNTSALRGAGDSRSAMIYNTIANVVNVFFNWCLIYGNLGFPKMGVAGASLATIIGQTTAFVIGMVVVTRKSEKKYLHLEMRLGFKPDKEALSAIFKIGFPSMIEQLIMRAGMIMFARMVVSLGNLQYATHQVCMNIQALTFMNGQAFATSATSLVSQSLGKGRPDMALHYSRRTQRVGMGISILIAMFVFFCHRFVLGLYTDDATIIATGSSLLTMIAFIQPFQSTQFIFAGALRGAGDTKFTAMVTMITVMLVRPGLALLLIHKFGFDLHGAWYALVVDQILRTMLIVMRYRSGKWTTSFKHTPTKS